MKGISQVLQELNAGINLFQQMLKNASTCLRLDWIL